jgi:hypothetical protein
MRFMGFSIFSLLDLSRSGREPDYDGHSHFKPGGQNAQLDKRRDKCKVVYRRSVKENGAAQNSSYQLKDVKEGRFTRRAPHLRADALGYNRIALAYSAGQ